MTEFMDWFFKKSKEKAFYGHAGRPGKVGGSVPASSAMSMTTGAAAVARMAGQPGKISGSNPTAPAAVSKPKPASSGYSDVLTAETKANFEKAHQPWIDSLSEDEARSVKRYTAAKYQEINGALRGDRLPASDEIDNDITRIDSALEKATLPEDVLLHRSVVSRRLGKMLKEGDLQVGSTLADKGFVSTSLEGPTVEGLSKMTSYENNFAMRIKAKKGSKGGYLAAYGKDNRDKMIVVFVFEQEVLIPRNTTMKIAGVTKLVNGAVVLDMEYGD